MSAQNANFFTNLLGNLGNTAQLTAAGYGNPAIPTQHPILNAVMNAAGYAGSFMKGVYDTPDGMPGIIGGLGNVGNRYAMRQYNQAQSRQAAQRAAQMGGIAKQLTGDPNFDGGFSGSMEDLARVLPFYANQQFGNNAALMAHGEIPGSWGIAPADQVQPMVAAGLKRQGDVTDYQNAMEGAMGQGFAQGRQGRDSKYLQPMTFMGMPIGPQGEQGALSGGVSQQVEQPQAQFRPPTVNPFFKPADIPAGLRGLFETGVKDLQEQQTLGETTTHNRNTETETTRHNKADETLGQAVHNATKANQGGYARYAPAGPAPQQITDAAAAYQMFQTSRWIAMIAA